MNRVREQHLDWLSLVDVDGQFLSVAALRKAFPAGLDEVPKAVRAEARDRLERLAETPSDDARAAWIDWLFREALEWGERYRTDPTATRPYDVPEFRVSVRAAGVLIDPANDKPRAVILRVPYGARFDGRLPGETWNASPIDRGALLARENGVPVALIEDGERIAVVNVPPDGSGGYAVWQTDLFGEGAERTLFASFVSLLGARRFFNVVPEHELGALFAASALEGSELTKTLGFQVRRAVELFVAALSSADRDNQRRSGRGLLDDIPPHDVYVAAATVMMRAIFLLYAEERGLLPLDDPLYAESYALSTLRERIEADRRDAGDEPLERRSAAWRRILALFGAIHDGVEHDRLRMPAYGGRLFDPARFPFLREARIDDLTVATILGALQVLAPERGAPSRRLSFRELDVEQIGHVYEGLLDHDVRRTDDVVLGFTGRSGDEPEIDLSRIEEASARGREALVAFLVDATGSAERAIVRNLDRGEALARERDVDTIRRVRRACENDVGIAERVLPYAPFLRPDLHDVPTVYLPGALVVRKTRARRDSGTEYTPRILAEEIVRYTLEPLCFSPGPVDGAERETWSVKPSEELLALKICDPACGSGAFLVAACRYLADRVVEAWTRERRIAEDDPTRDAQRLVAQRCIYGVDRDGMAVEMAKLSLWLLTFSRERPFGFLDHAIREGDSLLGITSLDQLRYLHRHPERGKVLHGGTLFDVTPELERLVTEARDLRIDLERRELIDVNDAVEQERLQTRAYDLTAAARAIADEIVGIELRFGERPERERDSLMLALADRVRSLVGDASGSASWSARVGEMRSRGEERMNALRPAAAPVRLPLHWPLEFPEVFEGIRYGFDAVIGNPPFLGGKFITGRYGIDYRNLLLDALAGGRKGHADLVAYFVLRAAQTAARFGLIATNTVGQGDTREVALDALVADSWRIVRAEKSRPWPGAAAIQVAEIWCAGTPSREPSVLSNRLVPGISPLLVPISRASGNPYRLDSNMSIAFIGSFVLGMGFTLEIDEAQHFIQADAENSDVLFPYLNGEDVCSSPNQMASRYVINFSDWSEERARHYKLFDQVERLVKPDRLKKGDAFMKYWWRHWRPRLSLYRKIGGSPFAFVIPRVSKYTVPIRVSAKQVFSDSLVVFALDDKGLYGLITSEIHRLWARARGSTMRNDTRYTPTDCFETFPLPEERDALADVMHDLQDHRAALMLRRDEGITTTYNRYHDPSCIEDDIERLRQLHLELDRQVLLAYGWDDLVLDHQFRVTDEGVRLTIDETTRIELLDRLLELNHARHAAETSRNGIRTGKRPRSARGSSVGNQEALTLG